MRKMLCALLCFIILAASFPAAGRAAQDGAVVNNPNPEDRLHLRQSPSISAASLGKYYNGTPVTVLEYRDDGWQKVGIGYSGSSYQLVGYMMEKYLTHAFGGAEQQVKSAMPEYITYASDWKLYDKPSKNASSKTFGLGETLRMMGYTDSWWHMAVMRDGEIHTTGFVPASSLINATRIAVVSNPNPADRLNLRTSASASAASLGKYYNGVQVDILSFHQNNQWAKVRIGQAEGYMMTQYLAFDTEGSKVKSAIPTLRLIMDKVNLREGASVSSKALGQYALNTLVQVWGVAEGWLHVSVGGKNGYMMASMLSALPGGGGGSSVIGTSARLLGDAYLYGTASERGDQVAFLGKNTRLVIQSQSGDWYRVRIGETAGYGWIRKNLLSLE